jgi:hypothetical protein
LVPTDFSPLGISSGELATIAFLVVFRVLIKDFFWIVMGRSLNFLSIEFPYSPPLVHEPCQTSPTGQGIAKSNNHNCLRVGVLNWEWLREGEQALLG